MVEVTSDEHGMFENVVVPLDGSVLAEGALTTAADLCRRMRAKLTLVRVHQPPEMAITRAYEWDRETRRREQEYLEDLAVGLGDRFGVEADVAVLDGHAADLSRLRPKPDERVWRGRAQARSWR